ncbi:MAG: hypothetical protein KIS94_02365 [Chitinophagales bacterium]|nr:hypothetical protein [Chitinophagales bacterium]
MGERSRVPHKDSDFNTYINSTNTALNTGAPVGAERLGLSPTEHTQWVDYLNNWNLLYAQYSNPATRTQPITQAKNQLKADFAEFTRPLLKRIEGSPNLTLDDRGTFNLPEPDTTPTARGPILEIPSGNFKILGGGRLEVRARRTTDATRASIHPLADAVELKYFIADERGTEPSPSGTESDPDTFPHSQISSKALFVINFSAPQQGKRIVAAMRWLNLTNPANNSGWSDLFSTIIA